MANTENQYQYIMRNCNNEIIEQGCYLASRHKQVAVSLAEAWCQHQHYTLENIFTGYKAVPFSNEIGITVTECYNKRKRMDYVARFS